MSFRFGVSDILRESEPASKLWRIFSDGEGDCLERSHQLYGTYRTLEALVSDLKDPASPTKRRGQGQANDSLARMIANIEEVLLELEAVVAEYHTIENQR
ncbi:uncharacterized protein L3040_008959 [Drepanopeziza brunnea f. sp. 'multigermtubi']|uniref:uncharacterized protein n=1 Tax=Drepanopeziza brunnea f. sp. 'multigermtubi' TaxID=698441 RepID=UPI0023849B04|nr:hypothetical protein L3040_008959 [Drepanopeziza brunnea f. sp. 'multigermtubi']